MKTDYLWELLNFIKQNKFYFYKDGKWYSTIYKRNYTLPIKFYTEDELIDIFMKESGYPFTDRP